jgi:hypothetical protein
MSKKFIHDSDLDFELIGSPNMCSCGKPLIYTILGQEGDWYVGRWCGCELDPPRRHFSSMEEAEQDLFKPRFSGTRGANQT